MLIALIDSHRDESQRCLSLSSILVEVMRLTTWSLEFSLKMLRFLLANSQWFFRIRLPFLECLLAFSEFRLNDFHWVLPIDEKVRVHAIQFQHLWCPIDFPLDSSNVQVSLLVLIVHLRLILCISLAFQVQWFESAFLHLSYLECSLRSWVRLRVI